MNSKLDDMATDLCREIDNRRCVTTQLSKLVNRVNAIIAVAAKRTRADTPAQRSLDSKSRQCFVCPSENPSKPLTSRKSNPRLLTCAASSHEPSRQPLPRLPSPRDTPSLLPAAGIAPTAESKAMTEFLFSLWIGCWTVGAVLGVLAVREWRANRR